MTRTAVIWLMAGIALLALAGCQPLAPLGPEAGQPAAPADATAPAAGQEETVQRPAEFAAQDLARRLAIPVAEVTVVEMVEMEWPDASVGCPQPDMMYAQVITPGTLITLEAGGQTYAYHSGRGGQPFLCENPAQGVQKESAPLEELQPRTDTESK